MHKHEQHKQQPENFELTFSVRDNSTLQSSDHPIFLQPSEGGPFKDADSIRDYIATSGMFLRTGSSEPQHICELGPEIKSGVNVLAFNTEAGDVLLEVQYHKIHAISLGQLLSAMLNGDDLDYQGEVKERRNLDGGVIRNVH